MPPLAPPPSLPPPLTPSHLSPGDASEHDRNSLFIYVAFGVGTEVLRALQTVLLTICSLRASRRLHSKLVDRLLRAPLSFYDGTTSGAVLNRVLSDLQNIDATVPDALLALATRVLTFCTQLGLVLYLVPYIALALPPLLCAWTAVL